MGVVLRLVVIAFVILAVMTAIRTLLLRSLSSASQQSSPRRERAVASLNRGIVTVRRIAWGGLAAVLLYFAARTAAVHDWGASHAESTPERSQARSQMVPDPNG